MMNINEIAIKNCGYVNCKSKLYSSLNTLNPFDLFEFKKGINKLVGDIDSPNWAISYIMSMYNKRSKDFILFNPTNLSVNNTSMDMEEFLQYSCYMDTLYPLFRSKQSVRKLVENGLKKTKINESADNVSKLFGIDSERFDRGILEIGNEYFKVMSAIGYSYGKQVFCFPWMSKMRLEYYNYQMSYVLETLENLQKIVVFPVGK